MVSQVSGHKYRVSCLKFQASGFGFRISGIGLHRRLALAEGEQPLLCRLLSARRPLLQGLGISVSGFGFRGSGVRFRVSRIKGPGFTVQGVE